MYLGTYTVKPALRGQLWEKWSSETGDRLKEVQFKSYYEPLNFLK